MAVGLIAAVVYGFRRFHLPKPDRGGAPSRARQRARPPADHPSHRQPGRTSSIPTPIALWKRYRARLMDRSASSASDCRGRPSPRAILGGLRALVLLVLVIAIFSAGDNWQRRLYQTFHPNFLHPHPDRYQQSRPG